jgi:hypothetical protein
MVLISCAICTRVECSLPTFDASMRVIPCLAQFPLDHYCPNLPSNGQCLYQVGCTPDPCIAQCPVCITDQNERQGDYTNHYYNDFFNLEPAKIYVYRIRFSNVDSCTGGTIPVGTTSSNCYTWSDWSDLSYVQVQQETTYSNIITESVSPISIRVGWVVPFNSASGPAFSGDQVIIYYGTDVSQVTTPFTGALTVNGGDSSVVGTTQGNYAVTGLKPATTYYFNVVGYFSTGNPPGEIAATRSGISFATKTKVRFTICLCISPDVDGYRAPKMKQGTLCVSTPRDLHDGFKRRVASKILDRAYTCPRTVLWWVFFHARVFNAL